MKTTPDQRIASEYKNVMQSWRMGGTNAAGKSPRLVTSYNSI